MDQLERKIQNKFGFKMPTLTQLVTTNQIYLEY